MTSVSCSNSLPPVKDDNREDPMVEGIPAKEEEWRLQGYLYTSNLRTGLRPFCPNCVWETERAHRWSSLKDHRRPVPTRIQELQPPQWWNLWRLPSGVGLQWADMSQEHEGVALRSIQGEEEGALEPSYTGQRDREWCIRERGHAVTVRRRRGWSKTVLQRCLKKRRRIWVHEDASLHIILLGIPRGLLYVGCNGDDEDEKERSTFSLVLQK